MGDKVEQEQVDLLKVMAALWKEIDLTEEEAAKRIKSMEAATGRIAEHAKKRVQRSAEELANLKEVAKTHADTIDLGANMLGQVQAKERAAKAHLDLLLAAEKKDVKAIKDAREKLSIAEEQAEAQGQIARGVEDTVTALTGISGAWKGTLIGGFLKGDFNENMAQAAATLKAQFSAANMLGSSMMKVQEATGKMVLAADAQFSKVNELTNGTGEYNDMIMDTMQNNAEWNVSMEDAGEAVGALYTDMSNFSNMTQEAQGHLVETTAQLSGLGIDARTTAANFEILNGALGMSAEQASRVQKDFAAMAADLGVSAGKIAKDFAANADVFVAYGDDATTVFKEVAGAAKATGIEMSALLSITTKMDTFEGAARSAGQLNAVLGGGLLNSMDLLNASEEERIRMLIESVEMSGKSWASMSKFEKQAVANAAGISDMTTASKLFGQSLSEYDAAQKKVDDNADSQEKLAERAAAAASMQEKLTRIFEMFAVAITPIVNAIHFLLNGIIGLNDMMGGFLIPTIITLLGIYKVWTMMQKAATAGSFMEIAVNKIKVIQEAVMIKLKALKTAATSVDTAATGANTTAKNVSILSTIRSNVTTRISTAQKKLNTMWGNLNTSAINRSSVAKKIETLQTKLSTMWGNINTSAINRNSVATSLNTVKTRALSMASRISAFFSGGQAVAQTAVGLSATAATPATGGLAAGITAIGSAATAFLPAITALGAIFLGLGLAIAGPFLAIAVLVWSLKELVIAFMEMPDAIMPALLGLIAFGAASMVALPMLALGIAMFVGILAPLVPWMVPVAIGLIFLGVAAIIFGAAAWLLGQGLILLGEGVAGFPYADLIPLGWGLLVFGILLIAAAYPFTIGAVLVGLAALILGFGLGVLANGVQGFTKRGMLTDMMLLGLTLIFFGVTLLLAAIPFTPGATLIGLAALILGAGLIVLAMGIEGFTKRGMIEAMDLLAPALFWFGLSLLAAAIPFVIGAVLVGVAALILGVGLIVLAKGIKPFARGSMYEAMLILPWVLGAFGVGLYLAGFPLMYGGIMLLIGALFVTPALLLLALAVKPWMNMDFDKLRGLGGALDEMTNGFSRTGFWLMFSGPMLLAGAYYVAPALWLLALAVLPWMLMDWTQLRGLGWMLAELAVGLFVAGIYLGYAAIPFFFGAVLIAAGMLILNSPLRDFAETMTIIEPMAHRMPAIAYGLQILGEALPAFGWGIWQLGLAASLPFFRTGLKTLASGLDKFVGAMGGISTAKVIALGQIFGGLAAFTKMSGLGKVFGELAAGITLIALALQLIPERKSIALSVAANSFNGMMQTSMKVTPQAVENVRTMAAAAADYATASRNMREPEKDALVQAIKEAMGTKKGDKKSKTGQDIVLEVDGKAFARAIDAAIDSRHSTSGW